MDERINAIKINSISAFKSDAFIASATIIPKNIKKFNKSIFFQFLKISFSVSALISFFSLFIGDFINLITFALASFFGMFAILTILFYIEGLYGVILNKINSKKQLIKKIERDLKNE